jgi:hypothetical protein
MLTADLDEVSIYTMICGWLPLYIWVY